MSSVPRCVCHFSKVYIYLVLLNQEKIHFHEHTWVTCLLFFWRGGIRPLGGSIGLTWAHECELQRLRHPQSGCTSCFYYHSFYYIFHKAFWQKHCSSYERDIRHIREHTFILFEKEQKGQLRNDLSFIHSRYILHGVWIRLVLSGFTIFCYKLLVSNTNNEQQQV